MLETEEDNDDQGRRDNVVALKNKDVVSQKPFELILSTIISFYNILTMSQTKLASQ